MDQNVPIEAQIPAADHVVEPTHPQVRHTWKFIVFGITTMAIVGFIAFLVGRKSVNNSDVLINSSISPTLAESSQEAMSPATPNQNSWKTHKTDKISFNYPPNLIVEERVKGFYVVLEDTSKPSDIAVSLDTRTTEYSSNFNLAVENSKSSLIQPVERQIENGLIISGKVGPGYNEGQTSYQAIFGKLDNNVFFVDAPLNPNAQQLQLFEQIISYISK